MKRTLLSFRVMKGPDSSVNNYSPTLAYTRDVSSDRDSLWSSNVRGFLEF